MGVSDNDVAVNRKTWGFWALRIGFGSFFSYLIFAFFALGSRGVHFLEPIPGLSIIPAIATAGGWWAASAWFLNITGGFVMFSHVFAAWFVAWIAWLFGRRSTDTRIGKINANANTFFNALHIVSVLFWYGIGMIAGSYVAGLLVWAIIDNVFALQFMPHTPGPWPGFDDSFNNAALAVELITGTILAGMITYFYLRNKAHKIPQAGAFIIGAATLLGFNISGPQLDIALFIGAWLAACTPAGAPACFSAAEPFLVPYLVSDFLGPIIGVILGYIIHAFYPKVKTVLRERQPGEEDLPLIPLPEPIESRLGKNAQANHQQEEDDVDELGETLWRAKDH